jgi:nucleoid-associated protein YgaU
MALEKAKLIWYTLVPPLGGSIDCQFNPNSLTISKSTTWKGDASPSFNAPFLRFAGGESATYSLALFFDAYAHADGPKDVREYTNQLLRLTLRGAGYSMFMVPYARPPSVILTWGKITLFSAVVEKVEITFTMFAMDGTPLRAKADIDFKQDDFLDDVIGAQNPTSRSDPRKTRIVNARQRLDQIAFEEYGDARYWRMLAEANGLDDPFSLQDNQILVIPEAEI